MRTTYGGFKVKKTILTLLLLISLSVPSFSIGVYPVLNTDHSNKDRIVLAIGSLALIYAGTHTMINSNNDLVTNLTGAGVTLIGGTGLYMTIFEW